MRSNCGRTVLDGWQHCVFNECSSVCPLVINCLPDNYCVNRELCSFNKCGGTALSVEVILQASKLAAQRIQEFHQVLQESLNQLEETASLEKTKKLELLRAYRHQHAAVVEAGTQDAMDISASIDQDDPMLAWSSFHRPAGLSKSKS